MPQALYLKYRPQNFDEVDGQDHIVHTLKNALAMGRIAHAYLFTGPRGTGKTSTARILAKAVNCVSETKTHPCNECSVCRAINDERLLDLIEIDAASNTGVEDIRELRDKVDFRPSEAKYKVYIIDEAHMLSNAAFNALLKTLEEPPPHVIFVLATTEPNKIPATISSRCQRFDFRRATLPELIRQLAEISNKERLDIDPAAIELIARQATGSFRDATSLLDQLMSFADNRVTVAQVQALLGAASQESIRNIVASVANRDAGEGVSAIGGAIDNGADPRQLAREIVDYLRGVMLSHSGAGSALNLNPETQNEMSALAETMSAEQIIRAIRLFNQAAFELKGTFNATLPLEMAVVESTFDPNSGTAPIAAPRHGGSRKTSNPPVAEHAVPLEAKKPEAKFKKPAPEQTNAEEPETIAASQTGELTLKLVEHHWNSMLANLGKTSKKTEALLRDAQPLSVDGNQITIGFFYELHKSRVEADKHAKPQIEKAIGQIFGGSVRVRCIVSPKKQKMKAAQDDPLIRAALNLGGKITDVT